MRSNDVSRGLLPLAIVTLMAIAAASAIGPGARGLPSLAPSPSDSVSMTPRWSASVATLPSLEPSPGAPLSTIAPTSTAEPAIEQAPSVAPAPDDDLALAGHDGVPGRLYCGGSRSFGFEDLGNPTGAEQMVGPEYDILRSTVGNPPTREVARDETGVTFLADVRDDRNWEYGPYLDVQVDWDGTGWKWAGSGDCEPRAWGPPGYGAATWTHDPAFKLPAPTTKTLHLLVSEWTCSSGRSAHGRIGPAYVTFDRLMVRIELLVRYLPGDQDCPGVAPTPARLHLPEPIGDRTLKDMNAHLLSGSGG